MSKLQLPDVSLVMMDTTCPELAMLAVQDSTRGIDFGDVVIFSNNNISAPGQRWVEAKPWASHLEYNEYFWYEVPNHLTTSHAIFIQWDSWIVNTLQWTDDYLQYDYVGAPWWYEDGFNVGNGCGLRSLRLMRHLAARKQAYPLIMKEEDHLLSRVYRMPLEKQGFRWAPCPLASRFAFECTRPAVDSQHFMFHDSLNFPLVLQGDRLDLRVRLMQANPYLQRGKKLEQYKQGRVPLILPMLLR
jgi:hypothetical protein